MLDTGPVTTAIAAMIVSGTTGQQIVAALVRRFLISHWPSYRRSYRPRPH
jgi:hypothetical protein